MENAGLANHMGSADPDWLKAMRRECAELRREIRILTHEFEDPATRRLRRRPWRRIQPPPEVLRLRDS
jgi:hypothetical protein